MSCGCGTSGDANHSCGTKTNGCEKTDNCGNSYKLSVFDWLGNVGNPNSSCDLVEVRFKNDRKGIFRNTNNLSLNIGSVVTVEANPGHDIGVVSLTGELVKIQMKKKNFAEEQILKIYRYATQKDIELWKEARKKEETTKIEARKLASALNLEMKITDVEFQGDGGKATFYYTADNRVDFRQLIKDYASTFKTKIDMKQIGFRQESAKVGGIGSCGRELCCSSWLTDFRSVNTNAARYQQLSINPQKLAGQCGKLKCCLNFELDSYLDALSDFPASNSFIDTEKGRATCIKIDVFKKKMWFAYTENPMAWHDIDIIEIKRLIALNKKGEKAPALEDLKNGDNQFKNNDLIQENQVNRFEKKNSWKGNKERNAGADRKNQNQEQKQNNDKNNGEATQNRNQQQGNKKFKKKFSPKKNNDK